LSAEKREDGLPSLRRPYPITAWDEPYMGEESISPPPAAKNALITSAHSSLSSGSSPTLKVIQLPRPIIGSRSPVDGIGRVNGAARERPHSGRSTAAAAPAAAFASSALRLSIIA
jgi:hypothetical protein